MERQHLNNESDRQSHVEFRRSGNCHYSSSPHARDKVYAYIFIQKASCLERALAGCFNI
jgi:hypothetical protein